MNRRPPRIPDGSAPGVPVADPLDTLLARAADRAENPAVRDWLAALAASPERASSADAGSEQGRAPVAEALTRKVGAK
jgi:hypothetical protein